MLNDKLKFQWVDSLKTIGILAVILVHIASSMGQFAFIKKKFENKGLFKYV